MKLSGLACLVPAAAAAVLGPMTLEGSPSLTLGSTSPFSALSQLPFRGAHVDSETIVNCGSSSDILRIDSLEVSPDPPVKGETLTVVLKGHLSETVTAGAYARVKVKLGLIKLIDADFDLCDNIHEVGKECPLEAGPIELRKEAEIPNESPRGRYAVSVKAFTGNDAAIGCIDAAFTFAS